MEIINKNMRKHLTGEKLLKIMQSTVIFIPKNFMQN